MKRIAILQSNYIPWKGYFDIINMVDQFVIYDEAQYTKRDWRNRNIIKTRDGLRWITIPVEVKGKFTQSIFEVRVADMHWSENHWKKIMNNYKTSAYFKTYKEIFEKAYYQCHEIQFLSEINRLFINLINSILGINTVLTNSSDFVLKGNRTDKIISLCQQVGAGIYISGPSAIHYLDIKRFEEEKIGIQFVNYTGYPEYNQLFTPFNHNVSILDLLFNMGPNARLYMKSF